MTTPPPPDDAPHPAGTGTTSRFRNRNHPSAVRPVPVPEHRTSTGTASDSDGSGTGSVPLEQQVRALYFDIAALLAGTLPEPPIPDILKRDGDDVGIFYRNQYNALFGDPEEGKTMLLLAAAASVLKSGGNFVFLDLDHNGPESITARLLALGVHPDILGDPDRFRYAEPEDSLHVLEVVANLCTPTEIGGPLWVADLIGVDSLGELVPMFKASSNSDDDFTAVHGRVIKPLVRTGAAVVVIDHLAKGVGSRASGPTGTPAKRRAIGGTSLRVRAKEKFVPGKGGTAYVLINKDRHGGLRKHSPVKPGEHEQLAAVFTIEAGTDENVIRWHLRRPHDDERAPDDTKGVDDVVARIAALTPAPKSANEAHTMLGGNRQNVLAAYKIWAADQPGTRWASSGDVVGDVA